MKRYRTGDRALQGRSTLEIPDGQVMALIGPFGAGKSTLIRCVNRLVEPTSGRTVHLNESRTEFSSERKRAVASTPAGGWA